MRRPSVRESAAGSRQSVEDRHKITAKLAAFRTSMLQRRFSPRYVDAIVAAVRETGGRVGIATPK